ncbi:Uncharacterized protein dnl_44090 [Desulfonema limicola]|uniref:Uncharacterized protein n=1 Tax=Desulfonema limicola TaxID=45656 RepID=A0A975BB56_9BACT|nr:Uncharacterized protein dnl_44090 [Desulfonema limicola]
MTKNLYGNNSIKQAATHAAGEMYAQQHDIARKIRETG